MSQHQVPALPYPHPGLHFGHPSASRLLGPPQTERRNASAHLGSYSRPPHPLWEKGGLVGSA